MAASTMAAEMKGKRWIVWIKPAKPLMREVVAEGLMLDSGMVLGSSPALDLQVKPVKCGVKGDHKEVPG